MHMSGELLAISHHIAHFRGVLPKNVVNLCSEYKTSMIFSRTNLIVTLEASSENEFDFDLMVPILILPY